MGPIQFGVEDVTLLNVHCHLDKANTYVHILFMDFGLF